MSVSFLHISRALRLLLVVCFVVAAVHAPAQRYKDKEATYSVEPPAGWTTSTENMARGGAAFVGPHELGPQAQDFQVNITITVDHAAHETLKQYVDALHGQLATSKEIKILKDSTTVLGGVPAHGLLNEVHVAKHAEIPVLWAHEVFVMHKDLAYILVLTYPKGIAPANEKRYIAAFNKFLASFQWTGEAAPKK